MAYPGAVSFIRLFGGLCASTDYCFVAFQVAVPSSGVGQAGVSGKAKTISPSTDVVDLNVPLSVNVGLTPGVPLTPVKLPDEDISAGPFSRAQGRLASRQLVDTIKQAL